MEAGDLGGEGLDKRQREHLGHPVVQGFKTREDGHLRQCRGVTRLLGADPWGVDLSVSLHFFFFFFDRYGEDIVTRGGPAAALGAAPPCAWAL